MARAQPLFNRANAGVLSPLLHERTDITSYFAGDRVLRNAIITAQGPRIGRSGWRMAAEVVNSALFHRILPFRFNDVDNTGLEFGEGTLRFYRDQGRLVVEPTDAAVTNGTFDVDLTGWTDRSNPGGGTAHVAPGRMIFNTSGVGPSNKAHTEQAITTTKTGQVHVARFRTYGDPSQTLNVQVGSASEGTDVLSNYEVGIGYHLVEFTPTASPFYLQFFYAGRQTVELDDVELLGSGAEAAVPLELVTPYHADDVNLLKTSQSFDVMNITARPYWLRKLRRRGSQSWSLIESDLIDGPYLATNANEDFTLQPAGTAVHSLVTVTAANHTPFKSTDVRRLVGIKNGAEWGYGRIEVVNSGSSVDVRVLKAFASSNPTFEWRLGLYADPDGHAVDSTFHAERFVLVGPAEQPNRIDMSFIDKFDLFAPGDPADLKSDDPIAVTLAADQVTTILWCMSNGALMVGGLGMEYSIGPKQGTEALTPTNVPRSLETRHGSADVKPVAVSNRLLFLQFHRRKLLEQVFDLGVEGFVAPDLTTRAPHLTRGGIQELAFAQEPDNIVWANTGDGRQLGLTYNPDEQVVGWHEHRIGDASEVDCFLESVAVLEGAHSSELWGIVRCNIGGQTKRFVCFQEKRWSEEDPLEEGFFVDLGLTLDSTFAATLTPAATTGKGVSFVANQSVFGSGTVGRRFKYPYQARDEEGELVWHTAQALVTSAVSDTEVLADIEVPFPNTGTIPEKQWRLTVTEVSGLDHLEGQKVQVVGDGAPQGERIVVNGRVAVEPQAGTVHVGLGFNVFIKPMLPEAGNPEGSSRGTRQQAYEYKVWLLASGRPYKIGRKGDMAVRRPDVTRESQFDIPPPLFTGVDRVAFDGDWDDEAELVIMQDLPLPLIVKAIKPELEVNP